MSLELASLEQMLIVGAESWSLKRVGGWGERINDMRQAMRRLGRINRRAVVGLTTTLAVLAALWLAAGAPLYTGF